MLPQMIVVRHMKKKLEDWGTCIVDGTYLHMKCVAHIIKLVVQDGLKGRDEHDAISCIRTAVRYIRSSPARHQNFVECVAQEGLKTNKLEDWGTCIVDDTYLHMRCVVHILKLVVQDGLKGRDEHDAISCIRTAVKYIRSSPARHQNFVECVAQEGLKTNKLLCLDVPTRWNSTYLMLEAALALKRAFIPYEELDSNFARELGGDSGLGVPTDDDWKKASLLTEFLRCFYDLTVRISGTSYVTSNVVFHEISAVNMLLQSKIDDPDLEVKAMAKRMKEKYDKYLGDVKKMNKVIYYAIILDPRYRWEFLNYSLKRMYGETSQDYKDISGSILNGIKILFNWYKTQYDVTPPCSSSTSIPTPTIGGTHYLATDWYMMVTQNVDQSETELEKYLEEKPDVQLFGVSGGFDVLGWWKLNVHRYPILARMTRDIMAVPMSTVASESTFSTSGRVLAPFRSSLLPKTVQTLICTQDWLRGSKYMSINVEEDIVEVDNLEKELTALCVGGASTTPSATQRSQTPISSAHSLLMK